MSITGLTQTLQALQAEYLRLETLAKQEVFATTYEIFNEAKANVPVDTGSLRGSGFPDVQGLTGKITFSADYAPYVEFGTGGLVNIPANWGDFALQFKGKGIKTVNLKARPFLIPAFEKGIKGFNQRMKDITLENRSI